MENGLFLKQEQWLSGLIMQNGEFVMNNQPSEGPFKIVPYFSNIASIALLECGKVSLVKKYITWYVTHLNFPDRFGINGTIYDYNITANNELTSLNDYDSYDSYPATFLSLCNSYFKRSKDYSLFIANKDSLYSVSNSLFAAFDVDNLTWAKPNYKYKYLMDNSEVYAGLVDASAFFKDVYADHIFADKLLNFSKDVLFKIENKLWNDKGFYYPYIKENGHKEIPNLKKWYPDAECQLFPIINNVIDCNSTKAKNIYNTFNKNFPNWCNSPIDDFPNMFLGYAACIMGDYDRAERFLKYSQKYIDNGNIWPWYNVESSYYIRTTLRLNRHICND